MRKNIDVVNLFVCILAAAYLVILVFATDRLLGIQQTLAAGSWSRLLLFVIGAGLVAWNLVVALREYRDGAYRRNLEITTEEGINTVSIKAIEDQLAAELRKAADVSDARVVLDARGEGVPLACSLSFKLDCQDDVMHRVDELKKTVRDTFFRIIPSGIGIEIAANVLDLVGHEAATQPATAEAGKDEFSGPKYPVSGGGDSEMI